VENQGGRRCLLVDELISKEEIVIKNLGGALKNIKGVAGGAIMGDGKISLILDIAGIFDISSGESE
jgi:two-component system chemotaxis sensor kinase CheA